MKSDIRKAARQAEADKWIGLMPCYPDDQDDSMLPAYPQEAEQPDRLWVGSGDAS